MGKNKKGFNWRARSQISGSVDYGQAALLEGKLENNDQKKTKTGGGFEVSCSSRYFYTLLFDILVGK